MRKIDASRWIVWLVGFFLLGATDWANAKPPTPPDKTKIEKKPAPPREKPPAFPEPLLLPTPFFAPLPDKPTPPIVRGTPSKPPIMRVVPSTPALPSTPHRRIETTTPRSSAKPLSTKPLSRKAADTEMTAKGFEDSMQRCRRLTQATLREELVKLCKESFVGARVNFRRIVEDLWVTHKVKVLMDMEVDNAASKLYGEYRYWTRLKSTFSKNTAKEMAERMARLAFLGAPFRYRIEMLSKDISKDLNKLIQDRVHHSVNQSMECVNSFLQSQYHQSMRGIFQTHVRGLLKSVKPDIEVSYATPSLMQQHGKAFAGSGFVDLGASDARDDEPHQPARRFEDGKSFGDEDRFAHRHQVDPLGRMGVVGLGFVGSCERQRRTS